MNVRRRSALSLSLVALGTVAGCAADTIQPVEPMAVSRQVSAATSLQLPGGPVLTPNGVPYRNPAYKHATGRSGLAVLSARALLNRDGNTDIEVSSGEIDGVPPTDPIHKLQLKLLDPSNTQLRVENHNGLDAPYVELVLPDAMWHGSVQIQGNVEVPNVTSRNNRTGVVTITERVNRRPDLAATDISAPPKAVVNTTVDFLGTIAELNGDIGARANCVFYVQGAEAARSNGILVAEGDGVNCAMSHHFAAVGTYAVTMSVESVAPGDWDLSNNSRTVEIQIYQPEYFLHGWASAEQYENVSRDTSWSTESSANYFYYNRVLTRNERHESRAGFYGYSPNPLTFPAALIVRQSTGGAVQDEINVSGPATGGCLNGWSANSAVSLCSDAVATWVNVSRFSGTAVYLSYDYYGGSSCSYRYSWGGYTWVCDNYGPTLGWYHYTVTPSGGGFQPLAGDYRFEVNSRGAGAEVFKADATVQLVPFSGQTSSPVSCSYGYNYGYSNSYCSQHFLTWWGKNGSSSF